MAFDYTVQAGDSDSDGVSISADSLTLVSGTLRDADGNDAVLTHDALADDPRHRVDGIVPTITSVAITSDPGEDDTYGAGDSIYVTVTFSEDIVPTDSLWIALDVGGQAKRAEHTVLLSSISDWLAQDPTSTVVLTYPVAVGDVDTDGISIPANALDDEEGRLRDVAGNPADISHGPVPDDSGHMVNAPGGL